jgi:ankyrin repeat protein
MEAARAGASDVVESLVAAGADPRATLADGASAAEIARRAGYPELAGRLRGLGAPVREEARAAPTGPAALGPGTGRAGALPPIVEAARRGDAEMLRGLLARAGALEVRDVDGNAPLHRVADGGHVDCVRLLLDAGADPNGRDRAGATPLMRAMASTARGSDAVVALLLARKADPAAKDANGASVLRFAARGATSAKLDRLAAATPSGFEAGELERALAGAVASGAQPALEALSARVAKPAGRVAALCAALVAERDAAFAALLAAGVALDRDCPDGRSPLVAAVQAGEVDRVKALLDAGADPERVAAGADTALIAAASRGRAPLVGLLLARQAEIDRRGAHRVTALMGAASNGHPEVVRMLLDAGADARMRSETDQTALDLARAAGHADVVALFESRRGGLGRWLGGAGKTP